MPTVLGPALGTALGFAQSLQSRGCSSAPMAAEELMPSLSRDPFPTKGPLSVVKGRMKGLIPAPQALHSPSAGQCCDPTAAAVPIGSWEVGGPGPPPTSAAVCLLWINGNQTVQPGKSLEAKSCCWSPSRSAELLAWVCLGGKWDVGWDLGSLRLGNCNGGVPADGPGELFPETSPRSRVEGKRPGNGLMALRGVARVHVPWECLTTWWGRSRPSPKSRGVQSLPRGSPRSSLRGGKRVSHVLQHTVGCGTGQIQPIRARSTARGRSRPSPLQPGTLRQPRTPGTPIPCTPALGLPLYPAPPPSFTQPPWWHWGEILPQPIFSCAPAGN